MIFNRKYYENNNISPARRQTFAIWRVGTPGWPDIPYDYLLTENYAPNMIRDDEGPSKPLAGDSVFHKIDRLDRRDMEAC